MVPTACITPLLRGACDACQSPVQTAAESIDRAKAEPQAGGSHEGLAPEHKGNVRLSKELASICTGMSLTPGGQGSQSRPGGELAPRPPDRDPPGWRQQESADQACAWSAGKGHRPLSRAAQNTTKTPNLDRLLLPTAQGGHRRALGHADTGRSQALR